MSTPSLHFLGWDRPLTKTAPIYLSANQADGLLDLEGTLLVVPTRQAGRRLLDALVARGRGVLSQQILTPPQLVAGALRRPGMASSTDLLCVWAEVLAATEPGIAAFLPSRDAATRVQVADRLQAVRRELVEAALQFADVARLPADQLEERERWQALAHCEAACHARLASRNLTDPCAAQIAWAAAPVFDAPVRRIVVIGVPDPSLLFLRSLENLPGEVRLDILVHAPAALAHAFDAFGRPLAAHWNHVCLDLPDETANLVPAAGPASQASRVLAEMHREADRFCVAETGLGVPDASVVPQLTDLLAANGVPAFDPQARPWRDHPLHGLVTGLIELRRHPAYRTVANLLRHPIVLDALSPDRNVASLLTELDTFQNANLPLTLADMLLPFHNNPRGTTSVREDFSLLGRTLRQVADWQATLTAQPLATALRTLLQLLLDPRRLRPDNIDDVRFTAAAEALDRVLRELEQTLAPDPETETAVLLTRLNALTLEPERTDEAIDLEGWLELLWSPAPFLLVTGFNEGAVPDTHLGDAFLPDSLRSLLNLRDDHQRAARDAFVFQALVEQRRREGRCVFICGKTSAAGDPLKPSRLLFRCPDKDLPSRARRLFGASSGGTPATPATISFTLDPFSLPRQARPAGQQHFPVTWFREYLRCPFRFYLRHDLDMQALTDDAVGPDDAMFGTLVHAVLDEFGRDPQLTAARDAERLAGWLEARVRHQFSAHFGPHPSLTVQAAADSAVQRLRRFAVVQAEIAAEWELVAVEQRLTLACHGFTVVGRIDRIERHRRDGRVRVLDYKTSERAKTPAEVHLGPAHESAPAFARVAVTSTQGRTTTKCWRDLQLPLYRDLLLATGRYDPAKLELGYFVLPRATGDTGCLMWPECTPAMQASAMACADGVLAAVAAGAFWPPRDVPAETDDFIDLFLGAPKPEACFTPPNARRALEVQS